MSKEVLLQTILWAAGEVADAPRASVCSEPPTDGDADLVVLDPDLIDRLPAFLESRQELLHALELAQRAGQLDDARRYAHRLAGSFSLYGFQWAAEQCRELETGPWPAPGLHATLSALHDHLRDVRHRLRRQTTLQAS